MVSAQVFESNPSIAVEGSIVLMNLNGQNAIEAIDPVLLKRCGGGHRRMQYDFRALLLAPIVVWRYNGCGLVCRMEEQAVFMEFREGGSAVFNREGERTPPRQRTGPDGKPAITGFTKEFRDMYAVLQLACSLCGASELLALCSQRECAFQRNAACGIPLQYQALSLQRAGKPNVDDLPNRRSSRLWEMAQNISTRGVPWIFLLMLLALSNPPGGGARGCGALPQGSGTENGTGGDGLMQQKPLFRQLLHSDVDGVIFAPQFWAGFGFWETMAHTSWYMVGAQLRAELLHVGLARDKDGAVQQLTSRNCGAWPTRRGLRRRQ